MMQFDNDNYMQRAKNAYFKTRGDTASQPCGSSSGIHEHQGRTYVVLRNGRSTLAVYRIKLNGILRALVRWPSALA